MLFVKLNQLIDSYASINEHKSAVTNMRDSSATCGHFLKLLLFPSGLPCWLSQRSPPVKFEAWNKYRSKGRVIGNCPTSGCM